MRFLFTMSDNQDAIGPGLTPESRSRLPRPAPRLAALAKQICIGPFLRTNKGLIDARSRFSSSRVGGARRDRTDDLMLAKHALSQLSYGPGWWAWEDLNLRPHAYQARALTN